MTNAPNAMSELHERYVYRGRFLHDLIRKRMVVVVRIQDVG